MIFKRSTLPTHFRGFPPEFFFAGGSYDALSKQTFHEIRDTIHSAKNERTVQRVLVNYPEILTFNLRGHHGHWVIPHQKFGNQFVTDFIIGESDSDGVRWVAVELESPVAKPFLKNGDPSAALKHAIRQIQDWRAWIKENRAYAAKNFLRGGLGLHQIEPKIPGIIVIGRRKDFPEESQLLRRQMSEDANIRIRSHDWLIESAALCAGILM